MANQRRTKAAINAATVFTDSMPRAMPASLDAIRERAFEIYEARGKESGHDLDDWLQAERQLLTADDVVHG